MYSPLDTYQERTGAFAALHKSLRKKSALLSLLRLVVFAALTITIYLAFTRTSTAALLIFALLFVILFFFLVRRSVSNTEQRRLIASLLELNQNELAIIGGETNSFADGEHFAPCSMHANDLDLFGNKSFFHVINRCSTVYGFNNLAGRLDRPQTQGVAILETQQAIAALAVQTEVRQMITAHALLNNNNVNIQEISEWLNTPVILIKKTWLHIARYTLPLATIAAFIYYLDSNNLLPVTLLIIVNWVIVASFFRYTMKQHSLAGKKEPVLQQYASILDQFNAVDPSASTYLLRLREISAAAHQEIFKLSKLTSYLDQRMNLLINFIGNGFFQYDIHCVVALEKWKMRNASQFAIWIETVGDIEALNSLSTFAFNHPDYVYSELTQGTPSIEAEQLAHPLIPQLEQVANDISIVPPEKLLLVTGSNMSGKSTFLRTLGINVLMAQCGLPVCARYFRFTPMKMLSSIRISDSLQENTSYFMAELKRLKLIITELETDEPALVLIDEVLRGTNSDDKKHGSEALIQRLLHYNCVALFATHDLSLSELETSSQGALANYCFESLIEGDQLSFDYRLRRGVATNKNASFLMRKMSII